MAHYVRFEIYIPVVFSKVPGGPKYALDELLVSQFIAETIGKYHGVTQSNPTSPTPYKGWWKENRGSPTDIDYLTLLFGLVRVDEGDDAKEHFARWKELIEGAENQKYVLVIFYPVQTIGEFFQSDRPPAEPS